MQSPSEDLYKAAERDPGQSRAQAAKTPAPKPDPVLARLDGMKRKAEAQARREARGAKRAAAHAAGQANYYFTPKEA